MTEQLPGLRVHINEGRLTGPFELPAADMQHIRYGGRVVMVLVADATKISCADTKDGDTKASWTFKVEDAAIVRDSSMKQHLADTLFLDLGLLEDAGTITVPRTNGKSLVSADTPDFDRETGEKLTEEEEDSTVVQPATVVAPVTVSPPAHGIIRSADPALEKFLNEGANA